MDASCNLLVFKEVFVGGRAQGVLCPVVTVYQHYLTCVLRPITHNTIVEGNV